MSTESKRPRVGDKVVLSKLPSGFVDDLPKEDQEAIHEIIGKPVTLTNYDDLGRAELEFTDLTGVIHFIFVKPELLNTDN